MQPVTQEQMSPEKLPESSQSRPLELKLGLNGPDQAAQTICAERRFGDELMQTVEEDEISSMARRWVWEATSSSAGAIPGTEDSDKAF